MIEVDKSSWTVHEPILCVCSSTKIGTINTKGGVKPIFILELINEATGRVVIKYLNVIKTLKGNYSVKHDSDFAKLYRITTGENPVARYSKVKQLLPHFIGYEFIAEYSDASTASIAHYFKVKKLLPAKPIIMDEWFESGKLKPKIRKRKQRASHPNRSAINRKTVGNTLEKEWKKTGNCLEMEKAGNVHFYLGLGANSIPQQHTTHKVKPLCHLTSIPTTVNDRYKTTVKRISSTEQIFQFYQKENETTEQYSDRVIEESF